MTEPDRAPDAEAWGPASLSNLGPGFDALGLALQGLGDRVEAWRTDAPGVTAETAPGGPDLPTDPAQNTAARAAAHVLRQAGAEGGLRLRVHKGIPVGSGIGGSAASAVAGAWAANAALGAPFTKRDLIAAVLDGEAAVSGAAHGDNVLPSLLGGLVLVSPHDPTEYRRLQTPSLPPIALVMPRVEVLTREARAVLPDTVPRQDAAAQAAELAFLLDALRAGDWEAAGRHLMRDRLAEPFRAPLVPPYAAIRRAALDAGAVGCALSGSGPALFALAPTHPDAVLAAMLDASRASGTDAEGCLVEADADGARTLP